MEDKVCLFNMAFFLLLKELFADPLQEFSPNSISNGPEVQGTPRSQLLNDPWASPLPFLGLRFVYVKCGVKGRRWCLC